MSVETEKLPRVFEYNGEILPDPNPEMRVEQVKQFYASKYPEIINCIAGQPVIKENELKYQFKGKVAHTPFTHTPGTKG